jgi:ORF6N domain
VLRQHIAMGSSSRTGINTESVVRNILVFRGCKVMLDSELAALYQVQARALNQAVQRKRAVAVNIEIMRAFSRFPLLRANSADWAV